MLTASSMINLNLLLLDGNLLFLVRARLITAARRDADALGAQLALVVLEERVKLVYTIFDDVEASSDTLMLRIVEQLVLSDTSLLHGQDELFAFAHDVLREIRPLELRLVQHTL